MDCRQVQKYLHAHLDGELGADLSMEIEKHLSECSRCRRQMEFEIQFIDRIRKEFRTSDDCRELEKSVRKALEKEGRRKTNTRIFAQVSVLAAAASIILLIGVLVRNSVRQEEELPPIRISEEVVKTHARKMPMEISDKDEKEVAKWFEGKVDFPVRPPRFASNANARLVGARLSRIKERDAAQLVYDINGHRVTFMIFDPGKHAKEIREEFEKEAVKRPAKPIPKKQGWVTTHRGYSVGLYQRRGITYTVTSDVGEGDIIKLLSSASH